MKFRVKFTAIVLLALLGSGSLACAGEVQKDARALEVLDRMAAYTATLDQLVIKGETFSDARLGAGLIVTNPAEILIRIDRPGSLHVKSFDGLNTREIYIHDEQLTIFNSETNFYAKSAVPAKIQDAMQFAIEELELEVPLAELFFAESTIQLLTSQDTVLYLTDKSRISGVDCHHIAIRGSEMDLQLWIEEGERPSPRKMTMTMKWEGGSPRSSALMEYSAVNGLDAAMFEFKPPEGAQQIRFIGSE